MVQKSRIHYKIIHKPLEPYAQITTVSLSRSSKKRSSSAVCQAKPYTRGGHAPYNKIARHKYSLLINSCTIYRQIEIFLICFLA